MIIFLSFHLPDFFLVELIFILNALSFNPPMRFFLPNFQYFFLFLVSSDNHHLLVQVKNDTFSSYFNVLPTVRYTCFSVRLIKIQNLSEDLLLFLIFPILLLIFIFDDGFGSFQFNPQSILLVFVNVEVLTFVDLFVQTIW